MSSLMYSLSFVVFSCEMEDFLYEQVSIKIRAKMEFQTNHIVLHRQQSTMPPTPKSAQKGQKPAKPAHDARSNAELARGITEAAGEVGFASLADVVTIHLPKLVESKLISEGAPSSTVYRIAHTFRSRIWRDSAAPQGKHPRSEHWRAAALRRSDATYRTLSMVHVLWHAWRPPSDADVHCRWSLPCPLRTSQPHMVRPRRQARPLAHHFLTLHHPAVHGCPLPAHPRSRQDPWLCAAFFK